MEALRSHLAAGEREARAWTGMAQTYRITPRADVAFNPTLTDEEIEKTCAVNLMVACREILKVFD